MKKIIELDDNFPTGEDTIQLVLPTRSGKFDVSRVTKTASEALDYIKNVAPEPGKTHLLLLALGGEETYGPNRNGDGFSENPVLARSKEARLRGEKWAVAPGEELTKHFKSFETNPAHAFKHHCFPAGTLVVTADRNRVPIESIRVGDVVATLEGPRAVTQTMARAYRGRGIKLSLAGELSGLTGTADHLVYVYRREAIHCPHNYNYIGAGQRWCHYKPCLERRGLVGAPEWAPMSSLKKGDYLVLPKPSHGEETVDDAFAELVGWVASEGYLHKDGCAIQFTFSKDNRADLSAVTACLKRNGLRVTRNRTKYNTVSLSASSAAMHARLSHYVQGTKAEKHITEAVMRWSEASLLCMLGAYISGDGHIYKRGRNAGQLRIRSSSRRMLRALSDVIRSLGVPVTVNWDSRPRWMLSPINGKKYWCEGSGVISVDRSLSPLLTIKSRKKCEVAGRAPRIKTLGDVYLVRILSVEETRLREKVYNLEVDGAHHYIANEVVVHNCNKDPAKASGVVKKAFWNPRMHRVELLTVIDNEKDAEWIQRVEAGEKVAVSMGCKISYDVCSICNNRAPTRADYCDHAKYAMNQVNSDGTKNFVYNPSPSFFDISRVFRPADRIAYTLKKVADVAIIRTSAELGDSAEASALKAAAARKLSDINKVIQGEAAATSTLSPDEKSLIVKFRDHAGDKLAASPSIPRSAVRGRPLRQVLAAADKAGVILKDAEFIEAFVEQATGSRAQLPRDIVDKTAEAALAAVSLFEESPALLDWVLEETKIGEAQEYQDDELDAAMKTAAEKRGYFGDYLYRRLVPEGTGLRLDAPPTTDVLHTPYGNTTRGAALAAQDAVTRAHAKKLLGGAALTLGGYKMLSAFPFMKSPLARGAGALGMGALGARLFGGRPGGTIPTAEGVQIPDITEIAPKTAAVVHLVECARPGARSHDLSSAKIGSRVDPVEGLVIDPDAAVDCLGAIALGL